MPKDRSLKAKKPKGNLADNERRRHIKEEAKRREEEQRKKAEAAAKERKARKETWSMGDKVLKALAKDAEDRRAKEADIKHQMEEERRAFKNRDKEWKEKVEKKVEEVKKRSLLMESIHRYRPHPKHHALNRKPETRNLK